MPPVAAGATGFTSAPSWSSVQGMHGLHPAASTGSTYSGHGDPFGQAVAAAGLTGAAAGVPAAAMGLQHQQPPQQPAAAAAGSLGFDDAAFAPADDWRVLGDVQQWYRTLLTKEKGIMYEDTALQVGLQSRYTRSTGELLLFLGNKQAGQPLSGVSLVLSAPSPAVQVVLGQSPAQLAPKQQVQVLAQVTCLQPFQEPPRLQLRYSVGARQVVQDLPLPLALHKFMVPEPHIAKEAFFDKWKSYAGPPLKMQQMLERGTPLGIDPTVLLLRGLNFGVEHLYLDPSPNNEAGAGYFMCGPPGGEQALLVQCRVEGNPLNRMQFRVTVAAPDAVLAGTMKNMVAGQVLAAVA